MPRNTGDNIYLGAEATDRLIAGISKTVDVIRGSYGSAGGNVICEEGLYPGFRVTNDGKSSIDHIYLADPVENIGANIIKEAGNKQDSLSGDGRKTTMILTEAIFKEAKNHKASPMAIKRSLDGCLDMVMKSIDSQTKPIGIEDVEAVARISSEDPETGRLIGEIYSKLGKEGFIELDSSGVQETFYEITEGVRLRNAKLYSAYSQTDLGKAEVKNPYILITKDPITSAEQLEGIFKLILNQSKNELVIYCEDIDIPVYSNLAKTHIKGAFKTTIIKAPTLWKDWLYEDFAAMTGATVVNSKQGKNFKDLMLSDLGTCDKLTATYNFYDNSGETKIIGIKDITNHIKVIKDAGAKDPEQLLRASWLETKVAILKVGGNSETELNYKLKKTKDAISASRLALEGGVVVGGGIALSGNTMTGNDVGYKILKLALTAPYTQIVENSGKYHTAEELIDKSIWDAALVVKNAVRNAISIAGTVITAHSVVVMSDAEKMNKQAFQ